MTGHSAQSWTATRPRRVRQRTAEQRERRNERPAQYAHLDLVAIWPTEHEKNLDNLIDSLEEIPESLSRIVEPGERRGARMVAVKGKVGETDYMNLRIDRSADELKTILDCLKEQNAGKKCENLVAFRNSIYTEHRLQKARLCCRCKARSRSS